MGFQNKRYQDKIRMTNLFIMKHLGYSLEEFIEKCRWKEDIEFCRNLIDDCVTEENNRYIKKKFSDLGHLRDRRNNEEYALDLILGWAVEDAMQDIFNDILHLNTSLNSADRNREFLLRPEASSDFIIYHNNQECNVEIISDYTGFQQKKSLVHLRDDKFLNLKAEDGILLGIDYTKSRFLILKVNSIGGNRVKRIEKHFPYGDKPAYEISLKSSDFYEIGDIFRFIS